MSGAAARTGNYRKLGKQNLYEIRRLGGYRKITENTGATETYENQIDRIIYRNK